MNIYSSPHAVENELWMALAKAINTGNSHIGEV